MIYVHNSPVHPLDAETGADRICAQSLGGVKWLKVGLELRPSNFEVCASGFSIL